jgi:hypothetical protein
VFAVLGSSSEASLSSSTHSESAAADPSSTRPGSSKKASSSSAVKSKPSEDRFEETNPKVTVPKVAFSQDFFYACMQAVQGKLITTQKASLANLRHVYNQYALSQSNAGVIFKCNIVSASLLTYLAQGMEITAINNVDEIFKIDTLRICSLI